MHFTLLRPPPVDQTDAAHAAVCAEAMCVACGMSFTSMPFINATLSYNLEMAEFGHLHDAVAHIPGSMHWLNVHGFAVTQLEGLDVHDRVVSAHGHSSPTLPCILLESPSSFSSSMLAQASVCVHVWPRWRVRAFDLYSAVQMPHLLIVFHFYAAYIEAPGKFAVQSQTKCVCV